MKFTFISMLLVSCSLWAKEKGSSFYIGEYFLSLSGHSYEELENKIYLNETSATACHNNKIKLALSEFERSSDVKDCEALSNRVFLKPDNTGFNISDFFHVGCMGTMKREERNFRTSQNEMIEYKFESRWNGRMIKFINLDSPEEDLNFSLLHENPDNFLVINKTYEYSPSHGQGKYHYKITETADKRIDVEYEVDNTNFENKKVKIKCLSKSLEEMNSMASLYE